jgi:hypothetical protein
MGAGMQIFYENQLKHQGYEEHSYATNSLQHLFINENYWILALIQPNNIHYQAIIYDSKKQQNCLLPHDINQKLKQPIPSITFH